MQRLRMMLWVLALLLIGGITWRLLSLYQPLPLSAQQDPLSAELYQQLATSAMLNSTADGRVLLPTQDAILAAQAACQNTAANCTASQQQAWVQQQNWLEKLHYTPAGQRIQQEVSTWNHSRRFAAIRDKLPHASTRNAWQAYTPSGWPVNTHSFVPLSFAAINGQQLPSGYHDWLSASHSGQHIVFQRQFQLQQATRLRLQVIGKLDLSTLQNLRPRLIARRPAGTTLELSLPAGATTVTLPVQTVSNPQRHTAGLALQATDEQITWVNAAPNMETSTAPSNNMSQSGLNANQSFQIHTRDGVVLLDSQQAQPSEFSYQNGLLALVGQDKQDVYSLNGLLAQSHLKQASQLTLTLDSIWQNLAQNLLNAQFTQGNDAARPRNPAQRTALVVINPNNGAVLAAASTPTPPAGVHAWDRATYSKLHPEKDPFQFVPWQGGDANQAPGSTFKIVTSLAILDAAQHDPKLQQVVEGAAPAHVATILGMNPEQSPWQPPLAKTPVVNNYAPHESLQWLSRKALYNKACQRDNKARQRPGLRESLSESLNTWFAAATVYMDAAHLGEDASQTFLLRTSKHLGFGRYHNLLADNTLPLKRYLPPTQNGRAIGRGDVLNAFLGQMALDQQADNLGSWGNRLVRSSFGQALSTTPLQMAQVAAVSATGKIPPLHLVKAWNEQELQYPEANSLGFDIQILREAMKAVVEEGTAASAFRNTDLACRTYGKTGTADVPGGGRTAWFVGWLNAHASLEDPQPQLAFACMVTHASGAGGRVCAPLIRDLLLEAQQRGLQP